MTRYRLGEVSGHLGDEVDVPDDWQVVGTHPTYEPDGTWLDVFVLIPVEDDR